MSDKMQLPDPQVLWEGTAYAPFAVRARLVRKYVNMAAQQKEPFKPTPAYVVETAPTTAAMGEPVWTTKSKADLPDAFFAHIFPEPTLVPQEEEAT